MTSWRLTAIIISTVIVLIVICQPWHPGSKKRRGSGTLRIHTVKKNLWDRWESLIDLFRTSSLTSLVRWLRQLLIDFIYSSWLLWQLACPVCRNPLDTSTSSFSPKLQNARPPKGLSQIPDFRPTLQLRCWQKELSALFHSQKKKGGIIDHHCDVIPIEVCMNVMNYK